MSDLEALIPPHEPAEETLATVGGMALDAIPIVGPLAGRALDHALATRERQLRHEFDVAVVAELARVAQERQGLTVADVMESDEFIAAFTRGHRAAAETASETKRRRLAHAVAASLRPSWFSRAERSFFFRLVEEFDDLHVWLLNYFAGPRAWLDAHDMSGAYESVIGGSPIEPLRAVLPGSEGEWSGTLESAIADLERYGLASIPLRTMMSGQGMVETRTTDRGRGFLEYLREPSFTEAEPPNEL